MANVIILGTKYQEVDFSFWKQRL